MPAAPNGGAGRAPTGAQRRAKPAEASSGELCSSSEQPRPATHQRHWTHRRPRNETQPRTQVYIIPFVWCNSRSELAERTPYKNYVSWFAVTIRRYANESIQGLGNAGENKAGDATQRANERGAQAREGWDREGRAPQPGENATFRHP